MIKWTQRATEQLDQAYEHIASSKSEEVAERITRQVISSVQQLTSFPTSGRIGRVHGTRELVIAKTPFIAAYTLDRGDVVILAVYHGAQKWPEVF